MPGEQVISYPHLASSSWGRKKKRVFVGEVSRRVGSAGLGCREHRAGKDHLGHPPSTLHKEETEKAGSSIILPDVSFRDQESCTPALISLSYTCTRTGGLAQRFCFGIYFFKKELKLEARVRGLSFSSDHPLKCACFQCTCRQLSKCENPLSKQMMGTEAFDKAL